MDVCYLINLPGSSGLDMHIDLIYLYLFWIVDAHGGHAYNMLLENALCVCVCVLPPPWLCEIMR